ncbi:hypothetical protein AL013_12050 [Mariprofundus ferrooxydans]|nr:hypothetical protein AL013_12050 [Mariprofundus ferrooxydans]
MPSIIWNMKQSYIKEMAIALLAAIAVGWVTHSLLGVIAFFVIGAFLSKGSVPENEMRKIAKSEEDELGCGHSLDLGLEYTRPD